MTRAKRPRPRPLLADTAVPEEALIGRWGRDPRLFVREALGGPQPWWRQLEILDSVVRNRETNVPTGNAVGKDWIAARVALWWLFSAPDSIVITTATTEPQVRTVLWGEIRRAYRNAQIPLGGDLAPVGPELKVDAKWYGLGLTARDPNAFAGHHSARVLLIRDEAAGIPPPIWEGGMGIVAGEHDRILNIGNPLCGPIHPFFKACRANDELGVCKTIRIPSTDTPNFKEGRQVIPGLASREMVAAIIRVYGNDSVVYRARVLGIFPEGAADGMISLEDIAAARQRYYAGVGPRDADLVRIGCDVARFGDDLTRIYAVRGPIAWECPGSPCSKRDGVEVARRLAHAAIQTKARSVAIDGGGLGAGPIDALRDLQRRGEAPEPLHVIEVQFGSKASDDERWADRRTELWWRMRTWFRDVAAFEPDQNLEEELLAPKYQMPRGTCIRMESKDDFKKRLEGKSPDAADALALAISGHMAGATLMETGIPELPPEEDDELRSSALEGYGPSERRHRR